MYQLENPIVLYALLLVPLLWIIYWSVRKIRQRSIHKFGDPILVESHFQEASSIKPMVKFSFKMLALMLIIIGIANPQIGTKLEEIKREGVDLVIAIDVSNSMMAEDLKPNRLTRATNYVSKLIDNLKGDRIGFIVFAGKAYLHMPITSDYSAAKLFLKSIDTDAVQIQGTAIGEAISLSESALAKSGDKQKVLIVITDGENHEDDAIGMAKSAAEKGIIIHTVGLGSPQGGPIPVYKNGTRTGFRKDENGQVIVTKMNPGMLMQVSNAGSGQFLKSSGGDPDLSILLEEIEGMEKKEFESKMYTDYEDRFQYYLFGALLFIFLDVLISDRKNRILTAINLFKSKKVSQ
jgi:Ca-activated chloride channel homolog